MNKEDIWKLYSYQDEEVIHVNYLKRYRNLAERYKGEIISSPESFRVYCLLGLFHEYRACNHNGIKFSSNPTQENFGKLQFRRLRQIEHIIGREIKDANDYLKLLNMNYFIYFAPFFPFHLKLFYLIWRTLKKT